MLFISTTHVNYRPFPLEIYDTSSTKMFLGIQNQPCLPLNSALVAKFVLLVQTDYKL